MLRKFGLDLTSIINSDPVWKVPKASRSSSRRARKDFAKGLKFSKDQSCISVEEFNMPVSEPEKCGIATLGFRFGEKPEHVPIKKRRFMFRSPSPPPVVALAPVEQTGTLTKACEVSNRPAASKPTSGIRSSQNIDTSISIGDEKLENSNEKFAGEDLSGISMLAVAACSSKWAKECDVKQSLEVEESSVLNRVDESSVDAKLGSSSKVFREDPISCSEMSTGGTLPCISTKPVEEIASITVDYPSTAVADEKDVKHASVEVDLATSSENASCREDEEVAVTHRQSSRDDRFHWDLNVVMDAWDEPFDDLGSHNDVQHEISEDVVRTYYDINGKPAATSTENSSLMLSESKVPTVQASDVNDTNHDTTVCHIGNDTVNCKVEDITCLRLQTVKTADDFFASGSDHEHYYAQQDLEGCSSTPIVTSAEVRDVSHLQHRDLVCPTTMTHNLSDIHSFTSKESCDPHFDGTSKAKLDNCLNYSDKVENAEFTEGKVGVDGRCNTHSVAGVGAGELQGYDSQYEDGELRESNELAWEDVDREAEHVNSGSEITEKCVMETNDHRDSEPGEVDMANHGKQQAVAVVSSVDSTVLSEAKIVGDYRGLDQNNILTADRSDENMDLLSGREQPEKSRSSSDMSIDDDVNNGTTLTQVDGLVDSKDAETVEETKSFRKALQSQIEAPISQGYFRDGRQSRTERFESGSLRSFERTRYSFQNQGRGRHGGSWDGASNYRRGLNNFSSNVYRRSELIGDSLPERENMGCDGTQDNLSHSHQVHPNCQAADEEPGLHPRYRPGRKFSPDRGEGFGRGRSFRYGIGAESRAGRGRYNGPSPDESFESLLKYRRPLCHRERSVSPLGARGQPNVNHIRGKSPSRSRSRSPIMWNPSRGRPAGVGGVNTFIRHRSRSPNFRSDVRTQRLRSPNQQSGFEADRATGFRPITRTHSSPPRNRWNSSRKDELGNFREFSYKQRPSAFEKLPGRIHLTGDRDTVTDSPRNMKPDGYYRISDQTSEAGAGRGFRFSENYDHRRKNYSFLRPARRSYEDGITNILHRDVDDSFRARNNIRDRDAPSFRGSGGFRGLDGRIGEMPRKFRGEQHAYMNERDGKFNPSSKQFADDLVDSSHNLNSEEPYRQTHMRRYSDMDSANRGRRYDNYEDKRKQYGSTNLMGRSENEGTKEILNPGDADENSRDTSINSAMGMKGFGGHSGTESTRMGGDGDQGVCGQINTPVVNSQLDSMQNSDNDVSKVTVPS